MSNFTRRIKNGVISGDVQFFILLFVIVFFLRGPTLLNDYYSPEEMTAFVQARDYISEDVSVGYFIGESRFIKQQLFANAFRISYEYGWSIIHFFTIIIVFLTACFVYFTGKNIRDKKTGIAASLFYLVMISSFNNHFMASGGEILANLFMAGGFYFFTLIPGFKIDSIKRFPLKGAGFMILSLFMGWCALHVHSHGIIFFIFITVFVLFYLPYREWGIKSRYFGAIAVVAVSVFIVLFTGYITGDILSKLVLHNTMSKIYHGLTPEGDYNLVMFFVRFVRCQSLLAAWHILLWVPAFFFLWRFLKKRRKRGEIKEAALVLLFILTYLMVFSRGSSLSFNDFITSYPFLAIIAALSLASPDRAIVEKIKRHQLKLLLLPALFFLSWNIKDIVIKYNFPEAVYNESRAVLWTRAILLGSDNNYLLPDKASLEAASYIKTITTNKERVFVWGDRPYINYYADRRMAGPDLRLAKTAGRINALYSTGTRKSSLEARSLEGDIISFLSSGRVSVIADVSKNTFSDFDIPVEKSKHLYKYIKNNYYFDKKIMGIDIYRRR